ncbi:Extracellular membrane protein, CFEM domain, fungi [Lasallia pustulata]|nr:Extracellular membrane protein, CFEM domain, fungi [Lasallia pustulata]
MHTSVLAVLASLLIPALSVSTEIAGLPSCAQTCLSNASTDLGSCSSVDIKCLCGNIDYINTLSCCLSQSCSTSDQQKALAFDTELCNSVNVTIPNFVGCALSSSTSSGSSSTVSGVTSSSPTTMTTITAITAAFATSGYSIESLYSTTTGAPVARFTGGKLLQGNCTIPQIASVTLSAGGTLEFPWLGCAAGAPNCCPWQNSIAGPLTICPTDYFTTSNACCPS